jgi:hypothetical protein
VALAAAGVVVLSAAVPALAASSSPSPGNQPSATQSSPSATAGSDAAKVTFGIGPATAGKIDRRSNFNYLQPRGGAIADEVALINLGFKPLTLNLYPSDALNGTDGSLALQPGYATPTDLAAWVTLKTPSGKGYVVVPPRSTIVVPFTVRVPAKAFVGDHLAGIVASIVAEGQTPGDRSTDIKFEQRIATRIAVRVAGQLRPELTIKDASVTYVGSLNPIGRGAALVTYTVVNTGNVRLAGHQEVRVQGLFGPGASAPNLPDVPMLLPGGSVSVTVEVPDVWALVSMTANINIDALAPVGDVDPIAAVATASVHFWAIPWTLLGVLLLIGLLVMWLLSRRRAAPSGTGGQRVRGSGSPPSASDLVTAGSRSQSSE